MNTKPNVNVTSREAESLAGKQFPCPVCGDALQLKIACTGKPYCHCDQCGIQLFFRKKNGIQRLKEMQAANVFTYGACRATILYNRLQQLKQHKGRLEDRQGMIFRDKDLDSAVQAVDAEIDGVRSELAELSKQSRKKNTK